MLVNRIQNGQTERIEILILNSAGSPITGLSDVLLSIRRISDDQWLDFDDKAFKSSSWVTRQKIMIEIDPTNDTGKYRYNFNTAGFSDDVYQIRVNCVSASNVPQSGELKVGGYVDDIINPITTGVNLVQVNGSIAEIAKFKAAAGTIVIGKVIAGVLSTSQMTTNLTESTNDHYIGRVIIWTSGALIGQQADITDYSGATKMLTFKKLQADASVTEAPQVNDEFVIV